MNRDACFVCLAEAFGDLFDRLSEHGLRNR